MTAQLASEDEFTRCRPWLEAALSYCGGTHVIEDVKAGIDAGDLTLVPLQDSALLLEVVEHPRKKVLNVFLAGGDLDELRAMDPWLVRVANGIGAELRLTGRKGWGRALGDLGWREQHVTLVRSGT